ncbi:MAG: co-chaperone GroES [Planctomycetota bacterium]|nr:MAG: co-chaperone GroES [Planctomycetota bacterium]
MIEEGTYNLNHFVVIGDRVLLRPKALNQTQSGLYLPPTVHEKETVQSGYVVKVGPGYPIPSPADFDEPYKELHEAIKYFPLQVLEGDLAIYLQKQAYELEFHKEKYVIVPQSAILMVIRDESLS